MRSNDVQRSVGFRQSPRKGRKLGINGVGNLVRPQPDEICCLVICSSCSLRGSPVCRSSLLVHILVVALLMTVVYSTAQVSSLLPRLSDASVSVARQDCQDLGCEQRSVPAHARRL
jgi:hypothetical protein